MDRNPISEINEVTMAKLKEMVDVNTIVGDPILTPDGVTIIPITKVTFGFTSGGAEFPKNEKNGFGGGCGAGIKLDPVGFLTIADGVVKMLNIGAPANTTVDRLVEQIPGVIEKVEQFVAKRKKD